MACRESEMQRGHHLTEQITHRMGSTRRNTGANISFAIAVGPTTSTSSTGSVRASSGQALLTGASGLQYHGLKSTCWRMELLSSAGERE